MKHDRKKSQPKNPASSEPRRPVRARAEDAEPSVQHGHLPVWIFIALAGLLFFGMVYLDDRAGGFNPLVYQRYASSNQLVALQPPTPGAEGAKVYAMTCIGCHMANGLGTAGLNPPLAGSEWVLEPDPARIIRIVLGGLQGPIQVKGQTYGAAAMVPWKDVLTDEQIADVLTYVRTAWGNSAPPVEPEQVTKVREETAGRATPWTAAELLEIPVGGAL